jgi:hypothetical protein
MQSNWNKSLNRTLASSFVAMGAAASGFAIPKSPCEQKPDVCCDEPKPGPFAFSYPRDMGLTCPMDFYFHVDGLAMQAKMDGLEIGLGDSNGAGAALTSGEVRGFSEFGRDWDYNPGVRFGFGFYLNHDAWNIDFNWTWLNITNYIQRTTEGSGIIYPFWIAPISLDSFGAVNTNAISAKWDAHYNTLDARLAKAFHVSRYLVVNPHFGVRAAWIDSHFSVHCNGFTPTSWLSRNEQDMWGFGTRAGVDTDWILAKGWSLFGNVAAAILFGDFDVEQHQIANVQNAVNVENDFYQNVTNMELQLGISWGKYFSRGKYRVGLSAAYEFMTWWDMNQFRRFYDSNTSNGIGFASNDTVSRGNLTLNGFSLKLSFDI